MKPPISIRLYSMLLRQLPIRSGLTVLSFNRFVERKLKDCTDAVTATYLDGTAVEVSLRDHDGRVLYLFGTNDPKVSGVSIALLKAGDVFLDIGANYGSVGLQVAQAVGLDGRVHLFEPQRLLCERVQHALESGKYGNVQLHKIGLLDEDGQFTLFAPDQHSGMATFTERAATRDWTRREVCTVRNIASYVPPLIRDKKFGAKVDVEGVEPRLLPWLLEQRNLRFVVFEAASNQSELLRIVRNAGLALYGLRRHPWLLRIDQIGTLEDMARFHDVVAIRLPKGSTAPISVDPRKLARMFVD